MAVTMKTAVFWDVRPCSSCKNRRFGGTYHLHRCVLRLLATATVVPSSPILVTLIMDAMRSSETSVLTRATLTSQETVFFCPYLVVYKIEC
jgi:hypothetical protein